MRRGLIALLVPCVLFSFACGGGAAMNGDSQGDADDGGARDDMAVEDVPDAEVLSEDAPDEDATAEDGFDALGDGFVLDAAGWEGSEYIVLPPESGCGDGILDPGEECDDWNRLNSDGCDWLCHLGDGDPAPEPDPEASDYLPSGEPVPLPGAFSPGSEAERIPLAWTGSEFATAWFQPPEVEGELGLIRFWRFDATGRRIDAEWRMPSISNYGGLEVAWTGSGYGLFFADPSTGLWYLRLDAAGKPIGYPVLIEGDTRARAPTADLAPDGTFVVAWMHDSGTAPGWSACSRDSVPDITRVRRVTIAGDTPGPVITVDEMGQGFPDIAAGDAGFGLVLSVQVEADPPDDGCAFRFVRLDDTLEHAVQSGVLGGHMWGDITWLAAESKWVTAWAMYGDAADTTDGEIRVAFFDSDGTLAGPPVRNLAAGVDHYLDRPIRVAAGDGGLSLLTSWGAASHLSFFRTDRHGVAISPLRDISVPSSISFLHFGSYNAVWTDGGFAVLFEEGVPDQQLYLQYFARAE